MGDTLQILALPFELEGRVEVLLAAIAGLEFTGTAMLTNVASPVVTVYQLYVAPAWRSKGVGSALVQAAERVAREKGAHAMSAVVRQGGPAGFWGALGYQPVHCEAGSMIVSRMLGAARESV